MERRRRCGATQVSLEADAEPGIVGQRPSEEGEHGGLLFIRIDGREGDARVIVDGHMLWLAKIESGLKLGDIFSDTNHVCSVC
jgi:hypothetical protein